ncbi:MAG: TonB-dependent receptor [Caulobacter sp.]|nr:TonB-dependent receptor [Caulobacter sp.]
MRRIAYLAGGSALAIAISVGFGGIAAAQDEGNEVTEVVVTGSLIAGTPEDAALPVDVIGADELSKTGAPSTVELLKSLSVSSGVLGDTNQFDARAQGSEGSGSVNLRGIGAQRTLVLLNGRRITPNPFGQVGTGIVDTNTIPAAAIARIEVLKDGAAATYGSDAIAGVVNFITRTNFEGMELSGSYTVIDGSDGDYTGSIVYGQNTDKANILLTAGFQHRSELATTERDWAVNSFAENPQGGYSGGNAITRFLPTFSPAPGVFAPAAGLQTDSSCVPLGGTLVAGGVPGGTLATGTCNWNFTSYDNLVEIEDRYQLFGSVDYDLTADDTFHIEALYASTDVPEWKTSPSYLALQVPTTLTSPAAGTLAAGYFVPSSNPGYQLYNTQNPGALPAFANGIYIPGVLYRPYSLGGNPLFGNGPSRGSRNYRAFRVSADLKGTFDSGVNYDLAVTYSEQEANRTGYDTVVSRFQLALRGLGGANCNGIVAGNAGSTCEYFNPFGNSVQRNAITGQTNPAYSAAVGNSVELTRWFFQKLETTQRQYIWVAEGSLSGKTGITLPGGDLAWAVGAQYRKGGYTAAYNTLSDLNKTPCIDTPINGSTACVTRNGPFMFLGGGSPSQLTGDNYAVFGELGVPIFDELQLQLAARYEDYGGEVGSTFDPKASLRWQAMDWLALRGSVGTTFRAPPITSLATGSVTSLQFLFGSFRAVDYFGNPLLEPESALTYNLGAIVNAGNFKASVDYWNFDFENPISGEPIGAMVAAMFPTAGVGNCGNALYAGLQARFTFQGLCNSANISRVRVDTVNGAGVKTSGVDFMGEYEFNTDIGDLTLGVNGTYTLEYAQDAFVVEGITVSAPFDAVGYLNYQTTAVPIPQLKGQMFAEWTSGPHNLRATARYFSDYEDQRAIFGVFPQGKTIDAWTVFDLDYRVFLPMDATMTVSVDNVMDEDPPFARLDLNYDPFTHSSMGRTYKFSLTKKF